MYFAWLRRVVKRRKLLKTNKDTDSNKSKERWGKLFKILRLRKGRKKADFEKGISSSSSSSSGTNKGTLAFFYRFA